MTKSAGPIICVQYMTDLHEQMNYYIIYWKATKMAYHFILLYIYKSIVALYNSTNYYLYHVATKRAAPFIHLLCTTDLHD